MEVARRSTPPTAAPPPAPPERSTDHDDPRSTLPPVAARGIRRRGTRTDRMRRRESRRRQRFCAGDRQQGPAAVRQAHPGGGLARVRGETRGRAERVGQAVQRVPVRRVRRDPVPGQLRRRDAEGHRRGSGPEDPRSGHPVRAGLAHVLPQRPAGAAGRLLRRRTPAHRLPPGAAVRGCAEGQGLVGAVRPVDADLLLQQDALRQGGAARPRPGHLGRVARVGQAAQGPEGQGQAGQTTRWPTCPTARRSTCRTS